jgi:PHD/YefM family antitoxin component YafN of YafNO toxin-antitoxin module
MPTTGIARLYWKKNMADKLSLDLINIVDQIAEELGDSPLVIERDPGQPEFVLVSKARYDILEAKADLYDAMRNDSVED